MGINKEKIQKNLKLIRHALGLSVIDMSNLLGVSKQTIYNVEQGKSKISEEHKEIIINLINEKCMKEAGLSEIIKAIIN